MKNKLLLISAVFIANINSAFALNIRDLKNVKTENPTIYPSAPLTLPPYQIQPNTSALDQYFQKARDDTSTQEQLKLKERRLRELEEQNLLLIQMSANSNKHLYDPTFVQISAPKETVPQYCYTQCDSGPFGSTRCHTNCH